MDRGDRAVAPMRVISLKMSETMKRWQRLSLCILSIVIVTALALTLRMRAVRMLPAD